jgi:GNAT superfamily N-acetyltransferase
MSTASVVANSVSRIRSAMAADLDRLVEMGLRFREETAYKQHLGENADEMRKLATRLIAGDGEILVSERDGNLVGMLGYIVYAHHLSGEKIAGELFWWVEPEARGDGLRLLRQAEKRAKAAGATRMQMISPSKRVSDLYERLGYEQVETTYQVTL